jgi:hypothetical protein
VDHNSPVGFYQAIGRLKGPVVLCGPVNKHNCELVTADQDIVAKGDIDVDDVKVFGRKAIVEFAARCFGNCCIGPK